MRSYTIGRVWGIPIRIDTSLLVFLPVLAWLIGSGGQIELYSGLIETLAGVAVDTGVLRAGLTPWVIGVAAAVGLFVSVTLHELGHSWVALGYGLGIESITLRILGGLASLESVPREWDREFRIAIAGPVVSLLVGAVCYGGLVVVPQGFPVARFVVGWLAIANVTLALFNLLPAFPMDGGRVLRALLARSRPYATATRIAGRVGVVFAFLFAVVGVIGFNLVMLLLALFLYGAATTESRTVLLDELLDGLTVGDIMTRDPKTVPADTTVAKFTQRTIRGRQTTYPVVDAAGGTIGAATESESFPTLSPHDHGGNLDTTDMTAGTTAYFPVFQEGGLPAMGDSKAAMADGEMCGTGAEIGTDVDVGVSVVSDPDVSLDRPLVRTPEA